MVCASIQDLFYRADLFGEKFVIVIDAAARGVTEFINVWGIDVYNKFNTDIKISVRSFLKIVSSVLFVI